MVQRSHTAMESSTQLVGDCMPGLLRMMMMIELETRVTTARTCEYNAYCRKNGRSAISSNGSSGFFHL